MKEIINTVMASLLSVMLGLTGTVVFVEPDVPTCCNKFQVGSVSVTLHVNVPEEWNYFIWEAEEEGPDWGIRIQVEGEENAAIQISGQHGTLNVSDFYPEPPETLITDQGLEAQYYKNKYETDDGEIFVDQYVVIGQMNSGFYGISLQMPQSIFDRNAETIQELLKSIEITEVQNEILTEEQASAFAGACFHLESFWSNLWHTYGTI